MRQVARKIFTSGFMIMLLCVPLLANDNNAGGQSINTLPWEIIAEKFDAKKPFCTAKIKDVKTDDFALILDALTVKLPSSIKIPQRQTEAELNLSIWQRDQWADLPPLAAYTDPNGMTVDSNAISEGFYNLSVVFDKNDIGKENIFHAVVTSDWKKDLFTWCRKNKEHIETNPDAQLIHSSIAVSHFDNLMEMVNKSSVLSEHILSALLETIKAKKSFEDGNCPDLVIGLNKLKLKRFEGAAIAEFVVFVPENYSRERTWPLLLHPDPQRWGTKDGYPPSGLIDIWWHFPLPMEFEWKDYQYFYSVLRKLINVDEDKIYAFGFCESGIATMAMALKYPDNWTGCIISIGNSYRHFANNAYNLSLTFASDEIHDGLKPYYNFAKKCFEYYGCRYFKPQKIPNRELRQGKLTPNSVKERHPNRIIYSIESLACPNAYWVQIDGRKDENSIASIDAIVWGQSILVKTDNVDAYTFNLELAPLDCNRPVEIIENNEHLGSVTGSVFARKSPKYENATYVKNKSLHGPVSDVFTDRYVVAWKGDKSTKRLAEQLAGSGPCFTDANLPADFINTHNIIFVGRPDKSEHFAQIANKLPVTIQDGRLTANGQGYEGDFGAIFVYPNPLNTQKYLAIFSASTDKSFNLLNSAWGEIKSKDNVDVCIFKASENNKIDWLIREKFNTLWDWHKGWKNVVAITSKKYTPYSWQQWVAKVIKNEMGSDIVFCQSPFKFENNIPVGQITYRNLFNMFNNDWIVKIKIDGKTLRNLLIGHFAQNHETIENQPIAIEGISYIRPKQTGKSASLTIAEIRDDKYYTIACPYHILNGIKLGDVIEDYKIINDNYLIILLKNYLRKNLVLNIDDELENIHLRLF